MPYNSMDNQDGEQTNKTDTQGTEADKTVSDDKKPDISDKKPLSDLEKLKADNAEFEKELVKGREMRAEMQKIQAEKLIGGVTDAGVQTEKPKEETPKEYNDRIAKEISEGKHDD